MALRWGSRATLCFASRTRRVRCLRVQLGVLSDGYIQAAHPYVRRGSQSLSSSGIYLETAFLTPDSRLLPCQPFIFVLFIHCFVRDYYLIQSCYFCAAASGRVLIICH